jgi:hypothetical protein
VRPSLAVVAGGACATLLTGCGNTTHYTYAKSIDCLNGLGTTQVSGAQVSALRLIVARTKAFDVLFLPSGQEAKNYTKKFKPPRGILHTKGNAIVYGHQVGNGPDVTADEMSKVEKCLA